MFWAALPGEACVRPALLTMSGIHARLHLAAAPGDDLDLGLSGDDACQIFVGEHDHAFDAKGLNDGACIARGA